MNAIHKELKGILRHLNEEIKHLNELIKSLEYYLKRKVDEKVREKETSLFAKLDKLKEFLNDRIRFIQ
ncbi:hypothetical protein LCGC14_1450040 [marine sediment metagenome]|uniref:Uncharacterized protein n=1 Tax=marine sediment metagenome TaxID=412755 RepID=A0A0F9JIU7_9ZZZZ